MKLIVFFVFISFSLFLYSAQESGFSKSQILSLTPEEMVFVSKLSDENRRNFCYVFSMKERGLALDEAKVCSPNESVERILSVFSRDSLVISNE